MDHELNHNSELPDKPEITFEEIVRANDLDSGSPSDRQQDLTAQVEGRSDPPGEVFAQEDHEPETPQTSSESSKPETSTTPALAEGGSGEGVPPPSDTPPASGDEGDRRGAELKKIVRTCREEALAELDRDQRALKEALERGESTIFTPRHAVIMRDLAKASAETGNLPEAEKWVDALLDGKPSFQVADACFAAMDEGSQHAFDALKAKLQEEKAVNEPERFPQSDLLEYVVAVCSENHKPADVWINEFAPNEEVKWGLYKDHLSNMAQSDQPDAERYQELSDKKATELVQPDAFPSDFAFRKAEEALAAAKDPAAREYIVDRFVEIAESTPLNGHTFPYFMSVGREVLADPNLASNERVEDFNRTIEGCTAIRKEQEQERGRDISDDEKSQLLGWRASLKLHQGASVEEVMSVIDEDMSKALSENPESPEHDIYPMMRRVAALFDCMKTYVERGDFESAKAFAANQPERLRAPSITYCLKRATASEQLQMFRPDEMTLAFDPLLASQFEIAQARIANDTEGLQRAALNVASSVNRDNHDTFLPVLKSVCEEILLRDESYGVKTTKKVLEHLRQTNLDYLPEHTGAYSEVLIAAGDLEEIQHTYEAIQNGQTSQNTTDQKWQLAELIEGRIPPIRIDG